MYSIKVTDSVLEIANRYDFSYEVRPIEEPMGIFSDTEYFVYTPTGKSVGKMLLDDLLMVLPTVEDYFK